MSKIVCNSSPIIGLCILERLDLLWQLFDEVIIPQEVYNEIVVLEERLGAKELKKAKYILKDRCVVMKYSASPTWL